VGASHEERIGFDHEEQDMDPRPSAEGCKSHQILLGSVHQGQWHVQSTFLRQMIHPVMGGRL